MRKLSFAVAFGLVLRCLPALAQDATPPTGPSRYTFNSVKDGFLRLDNVNGQVTFCSSTSAGWACQAVPEDRAALEKEIARLQDQVAGLKTEIAALREPPRPPADLSPPSGRDDAAKIREDLARAKVAIGNAWQRLVDMIVGFQKDMMRKG
jgi:cell division protein FtsB